MDWEQDLGVYGADEQGVWILVHRYHGGEYRLVDIVTCFELGRLEKQEGSGESTLLLNAREIRLLKTMADAYSFDYEDGFIEMCLEMHQFASPAGNGSFSFIANF